MDQIQKIVLKMTNMDCDDAYVAQMFTVIDSICNCLREHLNYENKQHNHKYMIRKKTIINNMIRLYTYFFDIIKVDNSAECNHNVSKLIELEKTKLENILDIFFSGIEFVLNNSQSCENILNKLIKFQINALTLSSKKSIPNLIAHGMCISVCVIRSKNKIHQHG